MGGLAAVPPVSSPRGNIIIVLITVFFCLSLVFLCIRLYTNLYIRRLLTASDWLAVAAFLFNIPLAVCSILGVLYGGCGKHINQLTPAHVANVQKLGVLAQTAYPISLGFTKCSICYLLAIMFPVRSVRIAAITLAVCCTAWAIAAVLVTYLICRPVQHSWNPTGVKGTCGDIIAAWTSIGGLDVAFDVAIFVLPLPMLAKLRMRPAKKFAIGSVFIVAVMSIFLAIIRTVTVFHVDLSYFTYDAYHLWIWTGVGPPIALMVACMISMRPFVAKIWPRLRSEEQDQSDFDSFTYPPTYPRGPPSRRRYISGHLTQPSHRSRPSTDAAANYSGRPGKTFLNMNDDHESDEETRVGSGTDESGPNTSAQFKGKNRQISHEVNELARADSVLEPGLPPMVALPPRTSSKNQKTSLDMQQLARARTDSIPEGEVFSIGATRPLSDTSSSSSRWSRSKRKKRDASQGTNSIPEEMFSMGATPALTMEEQERSSRGKSLFAIASGSPPEKKRGLWRYGG